jgi:hypothetical protein
MRNPFVIAIIVAAIAVFALSGCAAKEPQRIQDPWSENCSAGTYAIFGTSDTSGANVSCEAPHACSNETDCAYLEIGKLPPRVGACVAGACRAYCGSGIIRECYN